MVGCLSFKGKSFCSQFYSCFPHLVILIHSCICALRCSWLAPQSTLFSPLLVFSPTRSQEHLWFPGWISETTEKFLPFLFITGFTCDGIVLPRSVGRRLGKAAICKLPSASVLRAQQDVKGHHLLVWWDLCVLAVFSPVVFAASFFAFKKHCILQMFGGKVGVWSHS